MSSEDSQKYKYRNKFLSPFLKTNNVRSVSRLMLSRGFAFFIETQDEEIAEEEAAVDSAENETAEESELTLEEL